VDQIYITDIKIDHVRHLKNIEIPLSENHMKHLIITGKNGSGKTSLLDALARYIYLITRPDYFNEQTIECENLYPADVGFGKNNLYKIEQRSKMRREHQKDFWCMKRKFHFRKQVW
jgi:AAA15 family ATPase/GTPase